MDSPSTPSLRAASPYLAPQRAAFPRPPPPRAVFAPSLATQISNALSSAASTCCSAKFSYCTRTTAYQSTGRHSKLVQQAGEKNDRRPIRKMDCGVNNISYSCYDFRFKQHFLFLDWIGSSACFSPTAPGKLQLRTRRSKHCWRCGGHLQEEVRLV